MTSTPLSKSSPELNQLAEEVGRFIEYWGFKKVHGRIWAHLYLSRDPLDATTLARRLKVSKTLMSFSVAELLKYDVILEAGRGPRSRVFLRANPDIQAVIFGVLKMREKPMLARIESASKTLLEMSAAEQSKGNLDPERIAALHEMVQAAQGALAAFLSIGSAHTSFAETLKALD